MEYEVRFYYSNDELEMLKDKLQKEKDLIKGIRTYEKTIQFNHSDSRYDFYSKEIDGRFRVRISSNDENTKCKLSWKRRLKKINDSEVNSEEEKEVNIESKDIDNFMFIIKDVMHFEIIESYERYRTIFYNDDIEISVDEYPFGIALEIENKSINKNPEEIIRYWVKRLGLNIEDSYKLSWDDKYLELCKEQNKVVYKEVTFDKDMPFIKK